MTHPRWQEESEESGEDFAEAIADVGHDEEEETAEEAPKSKRKVSVFHISGPAVVRITSLEAPDDYEASFVLKEAKDYVITREEIQGR